MNRNQQDVIEYRQEEIRMIKELLGCLFQPRRVGHWSVQLRGDQPNQC